MSDASLLEVRGLKKYFPIEEGLLRRVVGHVRAVDHVNLSIGKGRTLGLVGESGSGKTTLGRCILRAIELTSGEILFHHEGVTTDLAQLSRRQMRDFRKHMQMIFPGPVFQLGSPQNRLRYCERTPAHQQGRQGKRIGRSRKDGAGVGWA